LNNSIPLSKELMVGFSRASERADRARTILQVCAGAVNVAVGGQDADPGVLVIAEPVPGRIQILAECAVDRVA